MFRKSIFIFLFLVLLAHTRELFPFAQLPGKPQGFLSLDQIKKEDRVLILAPHPDDETIGCAGIIQQALKAKAEVRVVYLTNGDHNELAFIVFEKRLVFRKGEFIHMGEVRRLEAIKAMKLLGLSEKNLVFLGYPDFGTFTIFSKYWLDEKPYKDLLTRISAVPYKEDLSYGSPYIGESILADLKNILLSYKPTKIFVSHPADSNGDHKALSLFLEIALADLSKEIPRPKVYPYLIHCLGWPLPRYYHPQLSLEPPKKFLNSSINWHKFELTPEQINKKYQAILSYKSQTSSSAFYLLSFARKNELFGNYPEINLKKEALGPAQITALTASERDPYYAQSDGRENMEENLGSVSYSFSGDSLSVRIEKKSELDSRFSVMLYLFGYNYSKPFAQMPKIAFITKHHIFKILDGKKIIKTDGITLDLHPREVIIKIPFKILGDPDFILTAAKTYVGILRVNASGFRKININKQ